MATVHSLHWAFIAFVAVFLSSVYCKQRVAVIGKLYCDGKPLKGATVKLYDKDTIIDKEMAKNQSGSDGSYYLDGKSSDVITNIDPHLYIYHDCNKAVFKCTREWIFTIPKNYIFDEKDKKIRPCPMGVLELMVKPKAETSKCLPVGK